LWWGGGAEERGLRVRKRCFEGGMAGAGGLPLSRARQGKRRGKALVGAKAAVSPPETRGWQLRNRSGVYVN